MTRIIIADPTDVVRLGIRTHLESCSSWVIVAEACDGTEAIEVSRAQRPDVVVLEYELSQTNGAEVTRQILAENPSTEVLIFTNAVEDGPVEELLTAGARGYVLKSDGKEQLVAAIASLAVHRPYFTARVSEKLLSTYLSKNLTPHAFLTSREKSIVELVADGMTNKQIAAKLKISAKTVEAHRSGAMHKLGLETTAGLVRYAISHGLVTTRSTQDSVK